MREEFIHYLTYEKRYSPHTIKNYISDLSQLRSFLQATFEIEEIESALHPHLRSWSVSLMEDDKTARTVRRKISATRTYFRWLRKYHNIKSDPTLKLILPTIPKRLPTVVEEDQMMQLSTRGLFPETFEGMRDRAIIEMFYHTGMRSAELLGLKDFDIDYHQKTIKVLGKRNKERIIPVSEELLDVIGSYASFREELSQVDSDGHFFVNARGRKLYPKLVYKVVNNYLGIVSSQRKKSPHVLRHTFATHMLNRGADLNAIKELLGHASLAATQIYTHNTVEKLKNIHRDAHPNG